MGHFGLRRVLGDAQRAPNARFPAAMALRRLVRLRVLGSAVHAQTGARLQCLGPARVAGGGMGYGIVARRAERATQCRSRP
jgi:hypothetical protein